MGMQEVAIKMSLDAQSVVSSAQNISEAFANITEKMKEAQEAGNMDLASKYSQQAKSLQGLYNGMANGNGGNASGTNFNAGARGFMSGVNSASSSVRGAINNFSQGDAFGGGLGLLSGGAGLAATFGGPIGLGIAAALAPVIAGGYIIKDMSSKYEDKMSEAMALNAKLNETERLTWNRNSETKLNDWLNLNGLTMQDVSETRTGYAEKINNIKARNTKGIRNSLKTAMKVAETHGYSAEEGIEQAKKLAEYGYNSNNIYSASGNIFSWAKATGQGASTLADFKGMMYKYGDKSADALAQAYKANQYMGLEKGQFGETLRNLGDIFRDGISKGFSRSIGEIGSSLSFLKRASGNSKFWTGDEGAKRYRQLSQNMSGIKELGSVNNIIGYRAIANMNEKTKEDILTRHGLKYDGSYRDNMKIAELGFIPEVFKAQIDEWKKINGNDKSELLSYIRNTYANGSYAETDRLYDIYTNSSKEQLWDKKNKEWYTNPYYNNPHKTPEIQRMDIDIQKREGLSYHSQELDIERLKEAYKNRSIEKGMGASEIKSTMDKFFWGNGDDPNQFFWIKPQNVNANDLDAVDKYYKPEKLAEIQQLPSAQEYIKAAQAMKEARDLAVASGGIYATDTTGKLQDDLSKSIVELLKDIKGILDNDVEVQWKPGFGPAGKE